MILVGLKFFNVYRFPGDCFVSLNLMESTNLMSCGINLTVAFGSLNFIS